MNANLMLRLECLKLAVADRKRPYKPEDVLADADKFVEWAEEVGQWRKVRLEDIKEMRKRKAPNMAWVP